MKGKKKQSKKRTKKRKLTLPNVFEISIPRTSNAINGVAETFIRRIEKGATEDIKAGAMTDPWGMGGERIDLEKIVKENYGFPPEIDGLKAEEGREKLHRLIEVLAEHHLILLNTDHLNDVELYEKIMTAIIKEPIFLNRSGIGQLIYHECCPCDDFEMQFKYYFDDMEREEWASEWDGPIPEREPLKADRDSWITTLEKYRSKPIPEA